MAGWAVRVIRAFTRYGNHGSDERAPVPLGDASRDGDKTRQHEPGVFSSRFDIEKSPFGMALLVDHEGADPRLGNREFKLPIGGS